MRLESVLHKRCMMVRWGTDVHKRHKRVGNTKKGINFHPVTLQHARIIFQHICVLISTAFLLGRRGCLYLGDEVTVYCVYYCIQQHYILAFFVSRKKYQIATHTFIQLLRYVPKAAKKT